MTTTPTTTPDPLSLELFAEFAGGSGVSTFASSHKDGEEWETNGRKFKRVQGKTVRVKAGDAKPAVPATPVASQKPPTKSQDSAPPSTPQPSTPEPKSPRQRTSLLRRLALEWGPKIKSLPAMLPAVATAAGLGALGAVTGAAGGVVGAVGAGALLNKAMDRGSKVAKKARLAAAKTPAEKRWAVQRNKQVYFGEAGGAAAATTGATGAVDPLAYELFAEFGPTSRRLIHAFASTRKEGEKWETAGRYFQRQNGQTVRIAAPDSGQTGGGGGGGRQGQVVLPPAGDFRVKGRPSAVPNLDQRKAGGRPGKDVTDVRQVRKARTRGEGPEPEAVRAYASVQKLQAIAADLKSRDPGVRQQASSALRDHATTAGAAVAGQVAQFPPDQQPTPQAVAGALGQANAAVPAAEKQQPFFGAVERHTTNFLSSLVGESNPEGFAGKVGGWVRGLLALGPRALVGGIKMLGRVARWTLLRAAPAVVGAVGRGAWNVATSDAVRPFLLWTATMAVCAGFVAAPFLAANLGMGAWSMLLTPLSVAGVIVTGRKMGKRVADVGLASKGVYLPPVGQE